MEVSMNLRSTSVLAAIIILGLAAMTFGQAGGGPASTTPAAAPSAPPPTKLAVVNIVTLFADLDEKKAADADIEKMKGDLETQGAKLKKDIDDLDKQLQLLSPGKEDYEGIQDSLLKKTMEYQSFGNFAQQKLFIELRIRTAGLYRKINDAVAKYAAANGIALVFVVDNANVEKATSQEVLMNMINSRKILYAHPDFDITSKIRQAMNIEFAQRNPGK
jgi:Skp family chaperone for outer membrane proteins